MQQRRYSAIAAPSNSKTSGTILQALALINSSIKGLSLLIERKERQYGKEIYLVSDEPYSAIAYDGIKVPGILGACKNSIIVTSYSKSLSIPGERIGYIALNPGISDIDKLVGGIALCNRILGFVNAPAFMQRIVERMQGI